MRDRWREAEAEDEIDSEIEESQTRIDITQGGDETDQSETDDDFRDGHDTAPAGPAALGDELGRIDLSTTEEGYVEGRITDLTAIDETTVELTVRLPHGTTTTFTLEKPIPWSRGFLLARIVEDVGYDAASIEHIVGEPVLLERIDHLEEATERGWGGGEWRDGIVRTTGNALLAAVGGHFTLEERRTPEWRLVDPLERDLEEPKTDRKWSHWFAVGCVLFGAVVAVVGALTAVGATAVTGSVLGAILPGLALVVLGCYWLAARTSR